MNKETINGLNKKIELMEMQYGMDTHAISRAHQNVQDSYLKLLNLRQQLTKAKLERAHYLPPPACHIGYTKKQIAEILTDKEQARFNKWIDGQTVGMCNGFKYNHETKEHEKTGCAGCGIAVYPWDLQCFLEGSYPLD